MPPKLEPKQTEDQLKQFDKDHNLVFFQKFRVVFGLFRFVSFLLFRYTVGSKTETNRKSVVFGFTKQTETQPKQI
jgi:hypothetical protein